MDPMIARAFLYKILTEKDRERLKDYEARLPPNHYLQGFEVVAMFHLQDKTITDQELETMNQVATAFSAQLWKRRCLEYKAENPHLTDQELTEVVDGKIRAENIEEWQEYAVWYYPKVATTSPAERQYVTSQ